MALLIIPILAMLAFSVDIGYITETNVELQNAADAAALAAAEQLEPYYVQYYQPGANQATVLQNARAQADLFASNSASFHRAGNAASVGLDTANDVVLGYQDANTPFTASVPAGTFPNTVQVTLRLDGGPNTNPQLGLFFGPVLGMKTLTVTAMARATIYNGDLADFSGADFGLLPATMDQEIWQNFLKTGKGSMPEFGFTAPTSTAAGTVPAPAVPNAPQIQVVPDPNGSPGGWNYLSLDSASNSNAMLKGWFANGLDQASLNALHAGGQVPLPAQPTNPDFATYFWKGIPGNRGGSEPFPPPGSLRILPLYRHVPVDQSGGSYIANDKTRGPWDGNGGRGQNCWYNIVQFVGVVVTDNTGNGLSVQPTAVSDPNVILGNVGAAGKPSSPDQLKTFFAVPKLTY
jgi:Flp pilus assembly protein TadG